MEDYERIARLERRVKDLERQVAKLMELNGMQASTWGSDDPGIDPKVLQLVKDGRIINAIKEYRTSTGVDLRDAKRFIDDLQERVRRGDL